MPPVEASGTDCSSHVVIASSHASASAWCSNALASPCGVMARLGLSASGMPRGSPSRGDHRAPLSSTLQPVSGSRRASRGHTSWKRPPTLEPPRPV
ncbi:hypothetical protein ACFPTY_11835 [Halomonas beimenensis]|uniref:hypothetical protein n=1 Tax=Halomonas beimenensis TaxID=475662 RepID=UPI0036230F7F